jgi:ABC-type sugar transport system permease subunit
LAGLNPSGPSESAAAGATVINTILVFSVGFALGLVLAAILQNRKIVELSKALFFLSPWAMFGDRK